MTIQPNDEIQIIQRIARQDRAALEQLYDRYSRVLYALAYRIIGVAEEAEEVVLDVFTQVWKIASSYDRQKSRVDTWLFMQTRSRSLDRLRKLKRKTLTQEVSAKVVGESSSGIEPLEEAVIRERRQQVSLAIQQLSEEQKQVIELAYFQGLTCAEIAARIGIPLGTAKTRIRLALNKLRRAIELE
jgi:RNA polymerase sigma-70 factor, ECF subfamily